MRLFAGIPIVDDARREIIALLGRLREGDWPVRGAPAEGPHLTLGRVREGHRVPTGGLEEAGRSLAPVPFLGSRLVLYESLLTTQGPRYDARLTLELGP